MSENDSSKRLSRRRFVRLSATSAGLLAAGGTSFLAACASDGEPAGPLFAKGNGKGGGNRPPPTRNPLYVPPSVTPTNVQLTAAPATVDLGGGQTSSAWAYNGSLPGPTLVAQRGGTATIRLVNGLMDETITHWHGMVIDDQNDGHPRFAIPPGGTYDYSFPIVQRACLNWYHPHPHGRTGEQVNLGLAGGFIIRDSDEPASLPAGPPYEIPLIIRDALFDKSGDLQFRTRRSGFEGDTPLINGTLNPTLAVEPAVYRFRVLNGANARIFGLALDNDVPFHLIGNDGGLLPDVVSLSQIDLSPAERADILVDFRTLAGATIMLRDLRSGWDLLEIGVSEGAAGPDILATLPSPLSTITPLQLPTEPVTRVFQFEGMSRINGAEFEMERIDETVPLGQTERWVFTTKGNAPHPVHVHASPFQVVERRGGRGQKFPWEAGWKDSVLLEDGETVEVLVRFDDPALTPGGIYLMHCHKLSHEDAGMMMNFQLV